MEDECNIVGRCGAEDVGQEHWDGDKGDEVMISEL